MEFSQIHLRTCDPIGVVFKKADGRITLKAEQSSDYVSFMTMINGQVLLSTIRWAVADSAESVLRVKQCLVFLKRHVVRFAKMRDPQPMQSGSFMAIIHCEHQSSSVRCFHVVSMFFQCQLPFFFRELSTPFIARLISTISTPYIRDSSFPPTFSSLARHHTRRVFELPAFRAPRKHQRAEPGSWFHFWNFLRPWRVQHSVSTPGFSHAASLTPILQSVPATSLFEKLRDGLHHFALCASLFGYNDFGQGVNLHRLGFILARLAGLFKQSFEPFNYSTENRVNG